MKGAIINHPLFGRGQVLELRNAGRDFVVRFDSGIRAAVPSSMLSVLQSAESETIEKKPFIAPRKEKIFTPEEAVRIESRHTIEALRYGLVPAKRIPGIERRTRRRESQFANCVCRNRKRRRGTRRGRRIRRGKKSFFRVSRAGKRWRIILSSRPRVSI